MSSRKLALSLLLSGAAACATAPVPPSDGDSGFDREVRGGRLHQAQIPLEMERMDLAPILDHADLAEAVAGLDRGDFEPLTTVETPTASGGRLVHVGARQQIDGVPIHGAFLNLTLRPGAAGSDAALLASSYHLFQAPRVDTTPSIGRDAAAEIGRGSLRASGAVRRAELEIWPLEGILHLVWNVEVEGADPRALVLANGARAGQAIIVDDRVYDAAGTVSGYVAVGGAPGGAGTAQLLPMRDTGVSAGGATAYTGADGHFAVTGAPNATVQTRLLGLASDVQNTGGGNLTASGPSGSNMTLTLGAASGEAVLAQATAYHFTTSTRAFLVANGFPGADFGAPLVTNTNLNDTCNAYFSPSARTINFFRSGGGCRNSAEASIIAHEYGHFVDDLYGGILDGGLSEGWGDTLACLSLGQAVVGGDLLPNGEIIRTCDNNYVYPAGGNDEVHALGQAWAGFVWHARQGLQAALGDAQGDLLIRQLVLPSFPSNAADIPAAVREVFLRDDDDGNLGNHTPHWDILLNAAQRHGVAFVVDGDLAAPAAVADLAASSVSGTQVHLRWTAPGDDGQTGTAASYELRMASAPITEASFPSATRIPTPDPAAAGTVQETTASIAPTGETIYFALRTFDEAGNASALSNVLSVTPPMPTIVYEDGAENGIGSWVATGLWHVTQRRAAAGTSSFWYGSEATGNYDTGAANAGTLTSPIIDLTSALEPALTYRQFVAVEDYATYDLLTVTVRNVDDPTQVATLTKQSGSTGGTFQARTLDLAPFAGHRVQLELRFDTVDSYYNATEGWFVDDIKIVAATPTPPPPPPPPPAGALLINEVLADPPAGYDANHDGTANTTQDEFVELLNIGNGPLDLSGCTLADSVRTRITFVPGTVIPPGQALVVFSGGAPNLPGIATVVTSGGLQLNNGGDVVRVRAPDGALLGEMTFGADGGQDSSLVRHTDGDAQSAFVRHVTVATTPASPGLKQDGSPFGGSNPPPPPPPPPPPAGGLVINEILADPGASFDANGDGHSDAVTDEFVELVNTSTAAMNLGGYTISDAVGVRVTVPAGTVIQPSDVLLVFGGGTPALSLPGVTILASGTLGLTNGGDTVTVRDAAGAVVATATYGADGGHDQSLVRQTDGSSTAALVLHTTVASTPASPGVRANGTPF